VELKRQLNLESEKRSPIIPQKRGAWKQEVGMRDLLGGGSQ